MTHSIVVARADEIAENSAKRVEVNGVPIAIIRCGERFYAIDDTCTHEEASLSEGEVWDYDCSVECPLHGARFSLETGEVLALPAILPVKTYPVTVENGEVKIDA